MANIPFYSRIDVFLNNEFPFQYCHKWTHFSFGRQQTWFLDEATWANKDPTYSITAQKGKEEIDCVANLIQLLKRILLFIKYNSIRQSLKAARILKKLSVYGRLANLLYIPDTFLNMKFATKFFRWPIHSSQVTSFSTHQKKPESSWKMVRPRTQLNTAQPRENLNYNTKGYFW